MFGTKVPEVSLETPLLFCALIALSAIHISKTTTTTAHEVAEFYHGCCIHLLIALDDSSDDDVLKTGVALATACLLRSYEILDGKQ